MSDYARRVIYEAVESGDDGEIEDALNGLSDSYDEDTLLEILAEVLADVGA